MDLQTDWEIGVHLRRSSWLMHAALVKFKAARLADALRAYAKYNPSQPRVPRGNPDGGQWTDRDGTFGGSSSNDTLGGGAGDDDDELPEIPEEEPELPRLRTAIIKQIARHFVKILVQVGRDKADLVLVALKLPQWTYQHWPAIKSLADEPKSLEELHDAVSSPAPGYQIHHIVEQGPAEAEKISRSLIDGPENLVRIPTFKHHMINGWYGRPNRDFGGLPPREYLRGKSWAERTRVGLDALILFEVLKP